MNRISTHLQQRLQNELAGRELSVQQAADQMDVPYWIIRDTLRGATDCPRPLYLPSVAGWLGISVEQLIDEAYRPLDPATASA